jgi:hypothetical protein
VLEDLADDFPLLRSLVDRRAGGQKRLPMPGRGDERVPGPLFAIVSAAHQSAGGDSETTPVETGSATSPGTSSPEPPQSPRGQTEGLRPSGDQPSVPDVIAGAPDGQPPAETVAAVGTLDTVAGRRRPARYGLLVQFESRPADSELGRLVDSTIYINDAHPAYARAVASRSQGYHTALAVALALAPLAVEARDEHGFITQFLSHWGGAHAPKRRRRRNSGS